MRTGHWLGEAGVSPAVGHRKRVTLRRAHSSVATLWYLVMVTPAVSWCRCRLWYNAACAGCNAAHVCDVCMPGR